MWCGALSGPYVSVSAAILAVAVAAGIAATVRRPLVLLLSVAAVGVVAGSVATARQAATLEAPLPQGRGDLIGRAATDTTPYGNSFRFVLRVTAWTPSGSDTPQRWQGPAIAVICDSDRIAAGDSVVVSGLVRADADMIRGDPVAGRVVATSVRIVGGSDSPTIVAGNLVRDRVHGRLAVIEGRREGALLAGFLIGDIALLPRSDTEALRRAGLTHYVAVSGSNVALVLGAWWLVLGLTGAGSRLRAITGLVVLLVFVVATRWESSVIRAATMAALVMVGRAVSVPIDAWGALGGAVAILLAVSGDLAYDVGFQLSAAATAGVLTGMRVWAGKTPRLVWALLAATVSAQLAVVPLLLVHFGTVPLLSPVANMLAAPLVTAATAAAGIGVIVEWDLPVFIGAALARLVLDIAQMAAAWPQLGSAQAMGLALAVGVTWGTPLRWLVAFAVAAAAVVAVIPPPPPNVPTVVFLDVGQGDAVLLRDPSGAVALIDGGRDPTLLRSKLREHGVRRIDLLVATHGDIDHVGGFADLTAAVDVGEVWLPALAESGESLAATVVQAESSGASLARVRRGGGATPGEFRVDVLAPVRRYAEDNDGSVVLLVSVADTAVLLAGDIGVHAQGDLGSIQADVLLVPHHGAATSDLRWLADTPARLAVISVGPNTYGHPAPEVVATLEEAGVPVLTTWEEGDIAVPLR